MLRALTQNIINPQKISADVCIVGGGIVGTSLASALTQSPYTESKKIVLIDSGDLFKQTKITDSVFSNRVSSITPTSAKYLNKLGVWPFIRRKNDYHRMVVWDGRSPGSIEFNKDGMPIATMVENVLLQESLANSIKERRNIKVLDHTKVSTISRTINDRPILTLENGVQIECEILVGADGPFSAVRHFAGIDCAGYEYPQSGLVATVELKGINKTAWQRFLSQGPLAILPISDTFSSIVWTLDRGTASRVSKLPLPDLVTLLNAALGNTVEDVDFLLDNIDIQSRPLVDFKSEAEWGLTRPGISKVHHDLPIIISINPDSIASFPLRIRHADRYTGDRVVLLGYNLLSSDAAHGIHPLAGQGLNLGLADSDSLARYLIEAIKNGDDVGHSFHLDEYTRDRYLANASMLMSCDLINRVFESSATVPIRSFGMTALDMFRPVKSLLMKFAS